MNSAALSVMSYVIPSCRARERPEHNSDCSLLRVGTRNHALSSEHKAASSPAIFQLRLLRALFCFAPGAFQSRPRQRMLAQMSVPKLLNELDALELLELRVFSDRLVEVEGNLPGSGIDFGILDRGLISHRVIGLAGPALGDPGRRAMQIAWAIKPGIGKRALWRRGKSDDRALMVGVTRPWRWAFVSTLTTDSGNHGCRRDKPV
ncbi:MAG: hypothetical protein EON61_01295 [Alphaproteobacteria bacterium]|nr:MAG: hypothetical protein EON61_01295 [Alphaproteobacteria bacterium]